MAARARDSDDETDRTELKLRQQPSAAVPHITSATTVLLTLRHTDSILHLTSHTRTSRSDRV